jgi:hypothetical protein
MKVLLLIAFSVLTLAACGGGQSARVLHFQGQDITETAYRDYARSVLLGLDGAMLCKGIQGLSAPEIVKTLDLASTPSPSVTPFPGGVPVARETGIPEDRERAAQIIQEECQRISP